MRWAFRFKDMCSGHGCFPARPNVGGSLDTFTNNLNQIREGIDGFVCHGCVICPCHGGVVGVGSPTVYTNNCPTARFQDPVSCGGVCNVPRSPDVDVGPYS